MECLQEFSSNEKGLTEKQVQERMSESFKFLPKKRKKISFAKRFFAQIKELMILVLLFSGVVSIVIGIVENSSSEIVDGGIIFAIVVMNALFGVFQERKGEKAVENLKEISTPQTLVLRAGKVKKIKSAELVFGDVVCLETGEIVPADLRLIESTNLKVNESVLTGESEAVEKFSKCEIHDTMPLAERKNMAYCGSVVEGGHGLGLVTAIGVETEFGKIAESLKVTQKSKTPLQKNIQSVGKVLTYLILLIAGVTFALEVAVNPQNIMTAFLTAVAISVAAIPESLPAVITIIMSLGVAKLAKKKAVVKRLNAVETLGSCDVICSDKTGTITQNKMKVDKICVLFQKNSEFFEIFLSCMILCNNCKVGESGFVGSSTEVAVKDYATKILKKDFSSCKRLDEIEFNSSRKIMATLNQCGEKRICFVKGALDRILSKCTHYVRENQILPLDENAKKEILKQNKILCDEGCRVLSFAYKMTSGFQCETSNLIFLGMCGIQDPPRKDVLCAVKNCQKAGMRVLMITGDHRDTALSIAKKVGIAKCENDVISGEELDKLTDEDFSKIVEYKTVFARVSPEHKAKIVTFLQQNGHVVAMTGDGVNDAPSLKKADIGIGMGKTGTDVAKDVSDMVVTDDSFVGIVGAVKEGRKIYSNIQKTIKYLFSANMAEILSLFLVTILFPKFTFLLPVQILFINLITDSLPAIALGTENVEKNVMEQRPRKKNSNLFSGGVGVEIVVLGILQTALTMISYVIGLSMGGESLAMTMAFYTLNLLQLFYMFTARTEASLFSSNPFKNKFFTCSIFVGFGLLALMAVTSFGGLLRLEKLGPMCWLIVLLLSLSIILFGEIYKIVKKSVQRINCIRK